MDLKANFVNYKLKDLLEAIIYKINKYLPTEKLVIIVDGLDEVEEIKLEDQIEKLFLTKMPKNTKIIYTINSDSVKLMDLLRKSYVYRSNYLEITPFLLNDAKLQLKIWLDDCEPKHVLHEKQWKLVDILLNKSKLTLSYLQCLFQIIIKWNSFHKPDIEFASCIDLGYCLTYTLNTIEIYYEKFLVSRLLFYLTVFPFGIQESVLNDLMNRDEQLLDWLLINNNNENSKFPFELWFIIRLQLKSYLTQTQFDGIQVITW